VGILILQFTPLSRQLEKTFQTFEERSQQGILERYETSRFPLIQAGMRIWGAHPVFGVGPGQYDQAVERYIQEISGVTRLGPWGLRSLQNDLSHHTHCLYMQLLVEFGIGGLAGFLMFLVAAGWFLFRGRVGSPIALAGLGLLLAFSLHNLLDVTFPSLAPEMGLLLGFSMAGAGDLSNGSRLAGCRLERMSREE
jgi:O-antigen ligase